MQVFCDDEKQIFIGVCGVDSTEKKLIKQLSKAIEIDFLPAEQVPDEITEQELDFNVDTIIVRAKDYNEDYAMLSDHGVAIYIIP